MAVTGLRTIEGLCRIEHVDLLRGLQWLRGDMQRELSDLLAFPALASPALETLSDDPAVIKAALERVLSLAWQQIDDIYPADTAKERKFRKDLVTSLLPTVATIAERIGLYNALIMRYNETLAAFRLAQQQGSATAMQAAVSGFRNLPQRLVA